MAHYLAWFESRFEYSHASANLSVHGLESIIDKSEILITIKTVKEKIVYYKTMDYIYINWLNLNICVHMNNIKKHVY